MQPNDAKEPSGDLPSHEHPQTHPAPTGHPASQHPELGAHSGLQSQRPVQPTSSGHPKPSVQTAPSQEPTGPPLRKPREPRPLSPSKKAAIRKRAVGRTRVPSKFRDSIKRFFFSPTGALKILRLGLLIGSAICFLIAEAHESYIVITVLETCIVLFFILTYMLTLHRLVNFMHWSLLDLINSCITTVFLLIVAVLAMQEKKRRHLFYIGGSLCLSAVVVCLIDAIVVTKKMRNLMKRVLRFEGETSSSPDRAEPAAESQQLLIPTPSPAPVRAPSRAPSPTPSPKPSQAPLQAPSPTPSPTPSPKPSQAPLQAPSPTPSPKPSQAPLQAP
ncbi:uncharacterized protein LOC118983783 [Sturnira hondurensis]|uniref:uncharacterized protein LOC118983783 n=1 Tax=Sturnira hondurensis TaxID=192404 RepID=UPI00187A0B38|nr:uncharacterized protein LOC118983783 [Sturnira hondurensis]